MGGISQRNRNWRSSVETMIALLARYTLSIIGGVVAIGGFVTLVTANSARVFVKKHPYPVYIALIVAVLIIMATLNYVRTLQKKNAQLTSLADRPEPLHPSAHDVRFYAEMLSDIPVGGSVMAWLKRIKMTEMSPTGFPSDVLTALDKTVERPRMRPVGFDDQETAAAFRALTGAIEDFRNTVEQWTFTHHNARWLGGTAQGARLEAGDRDVLTDTLVSLDAKLIQSYDTFIITAHARGIDADLPSTGGEKVEAK